MFNSCKGYNPEAKEHTLFFWFDDKSHSKLMLSGLIILSGAAGFLSGIVAINFLSTGEAVGIGCGVSTGVFSFFAGADVATTAYANRNTSEEAKPINSTV